MNRVVLCGRVTKDPTINYSNGANGQMCIARFSLAVQRKTKNAEGKYDSDFINCVAFGKNGEFAEKYATKGLKLIVEGHIQTGSYIDKEKWNKVYTFDVIVDSQEFAESKQTAQNNGVQQPSNNQQSVTPLGMGMPILNDDFMKLSDADMEGLPFQ